MEKKNITVRIIKKIHDLYEYRDIYIDVKNAQFYFTNVTYV